METLLLLNPQNTAKELAETWPVRISARAVVVDAENQIALLHVQNHNYYKLPGGGLDEDETIQSALKRECREEIGCDIAIQRPIGVIEEYRTIFKLRQISHCYAAKVSGRKGKPTFTKIEQAQNFSLLWCEVNQAKAFLLHSLPNNQEGQDYIVPRDLAILNKAIAMLEAD
jgi:ADP-ribose pyrophosphatase YjhB (NUDIX family)